MNWCALHPCIIDHLCLTSDFCQVPRRNFLQIFLFLIHCCMCCGYLHGLRHRNRFVNQMKMLQWIVTLSYNMVHRTMPVRCWVAETRVSTSRNLSASTSSVNNRTPSHLVSKPWTSSPRQVTPIRAEKSRMDSWVPVTQKVCVDHVRDLSAT